MPTPQKRARCIRTWMRESGNRCLFVDENTEPTTSEFDPSNRASSTPRPGNCDPYLGPQERRPGQRHLERARTVGPLGVGSPATDCRQSPLASRTCRGADDPNRVYALIETSDGVPLPGVEAERGELWRSDDAGESWKVVSYDPATRGADPVLQPMSVMPTTRTRRTSSRPLGEDARRWAHHDRSAVQRGGLPAITTTSGSTRPTATGWRRPRRRAQPDPATGGRAGRSSSCRSRRSTM